MDIETNVVDVTNTTTIIGYRNKWTLYNTIPQLLMDIETIVVYMTDTTTIIGYRNKNVVDVYHRYHNYYWI